MFNCFSFLFRYRKWSLGNDIDLLVRCEHDAAFFGPTGDMQMMNIKALNEWDSRVSHSAIVTYNSKFFLTNPASWVLSRLILKKWIQNATPQLIFSVPSLQCSGGVDWRAKLDNQRGAVLATELKNNSCKLAKWTGCAMLAGSDQLKFGWVW